jgi:hypothetical protein
LKVQIEIEGSNRMSYVESSVAVECKICNKDYQPGDDQEREIPHRRVLATLVPNGWAYAAKLASAERVQQD